MSKNMILVNSEWSDQNTFKMIPVSRDCPYNEAIFDPNEKILAIVSKEKKDTFHFLPKLNDNGDILMVKGQPRPKGQPYAEQRVSVPTYYEYFLSSKEDIVSFITMFASNEAVFDYKSFIEDSFKSEEKK